MGASELGTQPDVGRGSRVGWIAIHQLTPLLVPNHLCNHEAYPARLVLRDVVGTRQQNSVDLDPPYATRPGARASESEIEPMKTRILILALLMLGVADEAKAKDKVKVHFRPFYAKFGQTSTTKIEIVSGPKDVKMWFGGHHT